MIPLQAFQFGEAAVRRGWCSLAEVTDALASVRSAVSRGEVPPRVEALLVSRGCLTDDQATTLLGDLRMESTGELIAGYRIVGLLGSGGVGTVYHAVQASMDRAVALKVMPVGEHEREGDGERFLREARAVARIHHRNIVRGFDVGETDGVRWIAMELLKGSTAHDTLVRSGPMGERRALDIVRAVASALELAWRHGVIHRDIKPSNVFLCEDGRPVLFDFGLAKRVADDPFSSAGLRTLATPHYASPEQIRRQPDLDIRTDIYSLGVTWYHLITARVPFPGASSAEIAARHLKDPFPAAGGSAPTETLKATEEILIRMCAKRREDRYADPSALLADLDALEKAMESGGSGPGAAFALLQRLVSLRGRSRSADGRGGGGGTGALVSRIEELQEENARIFCERDLMRHEMIQDEKTIEHLESENARLACSNDLLRAEVDALRAAMDGLRLRRDSQRRARAES